MMQKKHISILLIALLATNGASYLLGSKQGFNTGASEVLMKYEQAQSATDAGLYLAFRNAASAFMSGNTEIAKCEIELLASSKYDDIKQCKLNTACSESLLTSLKNKIPEVFGNEKIPFSYHSAGENGKRTCDKNVTGNK